jgi:spore coat protein U-like protein
MKLSNAVKSALPVAVLGFLALGLAPMPADASTVTTTFGVTSTVSATCTVSAGTLAFGTYTGLLTTATSTVTVTCTNTTPYNIGLSAGLATNATVTTRSMTGPGSALLGYHLFSDASYALNWGVTVGTDTVAGTGNGAAQLLTIYGQIPSAEYVAPGAFTDTITATVTY